MELLNKKIVLIVSGGIAAYKAVDLTSRLVHEGAQVRVIMTEAARQFVQPLSFEAICQHPVYSEVIESPNAWEMEHISWARWADAAIVAPATANTIARYAHGIAGDAAITFLLAFDGPVWVAPAMNTKMLEHPATTSNLELLKSRGVHLIDTDSGVLACGEVGAGRMAQPEHIVALLHKAPEPSRPTRPDVVDQPATSGPLAGQRVLVTTGPTREMLDPIRFISNVSSGRMGIEIALAAQRLGAQVVLVHGPINLGVPAGMVDVPVNGAEEMLAAVQERLADCDFGVFAAAVANYQMPTKDAQKIKGGEKLTLELTRTPDIAAWAGANRRPGQLLIGFAAESQNLMEAAQRKLENKQLDLICANAIGVPGQGFQAEDNQVTILARDGWQMASPKDTKPRIAQWIWEHAMVWKAQQAA